MPLRKCFLTCAAAVAVLLVLNSVTACRGSMRTDDSRSDSQQAALKAVDDSMSANSPATLAMLRRGMKNAADSLEYYDFYIRMLRYNTVRNVPDTVREQWERAYRFLNSRPATPRVNGMLGRLHSASAFFDVRYRRDSRQIKAHYAEACRLLAESDRLEDLPDAYANLGDAYMDDNDMPQAAMLYRRALVVADSLNLPGRSTVGLYLGLGRIYLNLKDFDSARECFEKTDRSMHLLPLNMQIYFLTSYGNYFYYTHDYGSSLNAFRRLENLLTTHGLKDSYDMNICWLNMADVFLNLGRYDEAVEKLDVVEPFFREVKFDAALYYCNTIRIGLAMRRGDTAEARRIISGEQVSGFMEFNLVNIRHRYLTEYFVKTGDYRNAFNTLSRNIAHNDSMQHSLTHMRTAEIMMRYSQDTLQLHHHIAMQEKDAHIRGTRYALYGAAMLLVMLVLAILFLTTYNRKRAVQAHMQLMRMKLMSARNRISPHFIFNVLNNRISSTDEKDRDELMTLAKLIRANLNMSGKFYVTLREELDFVRYYISVEQANVGEDFEFTVNAPDYSILEEITVPSMFVQILVENAIKHALKGRQGRKTLNISVERGDGCWTVSVTDNGPGFDIRRSNPDSTGTGLKVIRSSISIINSTSKRKIRLSIKNMRDAADSISGCRISLTLPDGLKSDIDNP